MADWLIVVIGVPGNGCHPIMLGGTAAAEDGLIVKTDALRAYERLFDTVAEH